MQSVYSTTLYIYIYIYIYIYEVHTICFRAFFVWAFKIFEDSWKFSMLLLYISLYYWPILMISGSNKKLLQKLEYTVLKPDCHNWWISNMQSGREDTLEERYAIQFCFKLRKMPQKRMECFRLLLDHFAWSENQFVSDIRDSMEAGSLRGLMWAVGEVRKSIHQSWLAKGLGFGLGLLYPDLGPCDICLFPKLTCYRYKTIEEMKESVTKVSDTHTQEDIHGSFQKLLERYNKGIAPGGDFEGDESFMCVLSIKVPIRKKSRNLSYATRIYIINIMSCRQYGYPWPSRATSPYRSSTLVGLQGYIPYPHIAAECMFELVVLLFPGHMWGSIGVHHLWARPCFSSCVLHVWFA